MSEIVKAGAVDEIKALHAEVEAAMRAALPKAIRIGELLTDAKASLQHGEWGEWCEQNLPFTVRTASNYMKVFAKQHELESETVSDLTGAYRMLREGKPSDNFSEGGEPDMFFADDRPMPTPGFSLTGVITHQDGSNETIFVCPSQHEGFFYVSYLWFGGLDQGGIVDATKKPIRQDTISSTIKKLCRTPLTVFEWQVWPTEMWTYNHFLYSSHEDYVQQAILGRLPNADAKAA